MIDRREILDLAAQTSLTPHVIEKDYVLGWILAGIYAHEELAEKWIFKGGTCLKKCFFETYRFSEDLDFTLRDEAHLDEAFLKRVFAELVPGFTKRQALKSLSISRSSISIATRVAKSPAKARSATRGRFHQPGPCRASNLT